LTGAARVPGKLRSPPARPVLKAAQQVQFIRVI
jgi:hypothetical protein